MPTDAPEGVRECAGSAESCRLGETRDRSIGPERLDWMTDLMTHRGPDDRGTFSEDGVALGVRRLSIIDVEAGHQPWSNETGDVWAILNGELYNHEILRADLREDGHVFHSRCDTEVLPHLYERFGDAFPTRLRGDFGIAVWDGRRRCAVLARDRAGVKPLYYAAGGRRRRLRVGAQEPAGQWPRRRDG